MRYNVGDKVKIKTDLVPHTLYGEDSFVEDMVQYCGRETTIAEVLDNEYILEGVDWYWTDEMLEENYKPIPKFRIGDKVRVKKDLEIGQRYSGLTLYSGMYECHDVMTIELQGDDNYMCEENSYWWGEDMLEKVEGMTVEDLLNKTNVEIGGFIIAISYSNANFQVTIGHNKINRNSELYKRFIAAYGDMIVDEISFDVTNDNYRVMKIKVDYAD